MRLAHRVFLLLIFAAGLALSQTADSSDTAAVLKAEADRNAARESGNKVSFASFMLDDFWEIDRFGHQFGKAEAVNVPVYGHNELDDYHVRIYGDAAIVTGRARFHDVANKLVTTRFTDVWIRTPAGWREASHHACVVAPSAEAPASAARTQR